jgi:protein-disulfide isomerase/uncharacterized membrane protein
MTANKHGLSTRTFFWIAIVSLIAAIATHGYLMSHHYALKFGKVAESSICNISSNFNCEAVAASSYSEFLGVPMALWGAAANAVLLVLAFIYPLTDETKRPAARLNLLLIGGTIAVTSVIMAGISVFWLGKGCPFCILTYVLSFVSFGALWLALPATQASVVTAPRPRVKDFAPVLIAVVVAFIGSFMINDQIKKSYGFADMSAFVQGAIQEWAAAPAKQIQTVEPLVKGPDAANAKMTIVEFADFRCIHCAHAAPVLEAFASSHPDVRFEFQVWPLDGECNSSIPSANGASCLLARTAYCAAKQSPEKGWATHKYLFEHHDDFTGVEAIRLKLPEVAKAVGLETASLESCVQAPETKSAVEKQAAVGSALNLSGTPTIYVNGKKLSGGQALPVLQEAYRRSSK